MQSRGVDLFFLVCDSLYVQLPQAFNAGAADARKQLLEVITGLGGVVCMSRVLAGDITELIKSADLSQPSAARPAWFHLGADIPTSNRCTLLLENHKNTLALLSVRTSFLMVGTLEPRKEHLQTIEAFEILWADGKDLNLVIVGKQGRLMDKLSQKLLNHSELGARLHWFDDLSDAEQGAIYSACDCLIAASCGDGSGLPIIAAASHKLPIIARDLPVFREIAGDHAFYFGVDTAVGLASTINEWLFLYSRQQHPTSEHMPWQTWKESANQLFEAVIGLRSLQSSFKI